MIERSGPSVETAVLEWKDNGTPVSTDFGDVYFSKENGIEETEHVFINGNDLVERFKQLKDYAHFCIAETGFGSGLNFLVAWQFWERYAPKTASLSFLSVEKHPIQLVDLSKAHSHWPSLSEKSTLLRDQYPEPVKGMHRCRFPGNVNLSLYYGDVIDWLEQTSFHADAWFLDGFSPKLNPEMWNEALFSHISSHTQSLGTLATFTAAGYIRRGLSEQGFDIQKRPGYGKKRDMTFGRFAQKKATLSANKSPKKVIVVGAGLAGAFTARTLAERGINVKVIDQSQSTAGGASGNPQGALYIKPAVNWSPHNRYHIASYLHAIRAYSTLFQVPDSLWHSCGVLQLAQNEKEIERQKKFLTLNQYPTSILYQVDASEASKLAGIPIDYGGLYFPKGGWCLPSQICSFLLSHPNIELHLSSHIVEYSALADDVSLKDATGVIYRADHVVFCTGYEQLKNRAFSSLPLKPIRGQISVAKVTNSNVNPLNTVLCGDGYALPSFIKDTPENLVFGATFKPKCSNSSVTFEDHELNKTKLIKLSSGLASLIDNEPQISGRASIRAAFPDYLPAIGYLESRVAINCGYGSKGLALAPLGAEIIADLITNRPLPFEDELISRVSPMRFLKQMPTN